MSKLKRDIKAVGFDVDGTLYHAPKELEEFFREKLRKDVFEVLSNRLDMSLVEVDKLYFDKKKKLGSNTATMESFGLDGEGFFQTLFDEFPLDRYLSRDERLIEILTSLRDKGFRLFILSNGTGRQVRMKLKALGVEEEWFDSFICAYDYGWVKPQREPFDQVLEDLGDVDVSECVYVGDRCETDIVGAKNVGMNTVLIDRDGRKSCDEADVVVDEVYAIGNLLLNR